ncbi:ARPP-1 family domain-containing protein [Sinomonas flava]|uniref:ARG and Rhodanese-Phosphatase-superfamily-associated domain-containing protein n=1 Tax=Sinomonas flava TaxID=496857 RepID=A0ABN3BT73_9MICC
MDFPQLHVGIGQQFGPFTIFPVWSDTPGNLGLTTGAHAQLQVTELAAGPQVNRLTVANTGAKPALLIEGELLEGGHQHRIAAESRILAPGEHADVPAFCVEEGRWGGPSIQHGRRARRAPLHVRAELAGLGGLSGSTGDGVRTLRAADQGRVWQRVGRFSAGVSATGSLVEAYDGFDTAASGFDSASLRSTPGVLEGQRGVVVGLGGRALTLELFGTSALFARHWEQFADALRFEAAHAELLAAQPTRGQGARDFVAGLATDPRRLFATPTTAHGAVASTPVRAAVGRYAYSGLAVQRAAGPAQFAHLSVWDATHPLAAL